MAILDKNIQKEIDEIRFGADQYFLEDKLKYYDMKKEAWDIYPEPKNNWNESYSLAKDLFESYLYDVNLNESRIWLNKMVEINNNLQLNNDDLLFNIAKYDFEKENYIDSLKKMKEVVRVAGMRYFEDEDPKYKDFYLHPEKYIKD